MRTHTQNTQSAEVGRARATVFIQTGDTASHIQTVTSAPGKKKRKKEKRRPARPNSGQQQPLVAGRTSVMSSQ